jgi:hypothetical protein
MGVGVAKRPKVRPAAGDAWSREKPRLLRSHRGWFVAYRGGRRVALEPTVERLLAALDDRLGTPRKPCEFHQIVEEPPSRRRQSPRVRRPTHAGR